MNDSQRPSRFSPLAAAALLVATVAAGPATADWVVTVDGARIETSGPWTERGKMIVFEGANGDLMSLRLSEVDLAASRELTRVMAEPATRPPAESTPRPSVFRLTDADVGHVDDDDYFADTGTETDETGAAEAPTEAPRLVEVTAWDRSETPAGDGLEVIGTLSNQGRDTAVALQVTVAIFDDEGQMITSVPAQLATNALAPGQTTELTATFPGVFDFTSVNFDVRQTALRTRSAEEAPEGGDDFIGSPVQGVDEDDGGFGDSESAVAPDDGF